MIKVNLLRNRVQEVEGTQAAAGGGGGGSSDLTRDALVKVAFILLFTLGLMMYENQSIRALNEENGRLAASVTQLTKDVAQKAEQAEKFKDVEGQAKELEDKLKILKLLSKLRLREVKTLDFMQSSIPEKVWLKAVTFESDKQMVQNGHYQFTGNSVTTEDLTEFSHRLDGGAYLSDVIVVKNQEVAAGKNGTIREFLFTAEIGSKN